jgi:hypothetical protein
MQNLDLGSNLGIDGEYFLILFVSNLNSNIQGVNSFKFYVNIKVKQPIMLDPSRHVDKNP